MTDRAPKNIVASIHQRLLNVSRQAGRRFNDLVIYYAIERFLYRLSRSRYANRVVLKGGLMLQVWDTPITRVTRDIDLLGRLPNDPARVQAMVREICTATVDDDGLVFDPESVAVSRIAEDAAYEGVRATFRGRFGKMPVAMQIDFGFSDVITPEPADIIYPSILAHPPAKLLAYNRETAVAEKFQAMTKLGELNSRMRDFFDVWALAQSFAFDGPALTEAVRATFARRETEVEVEPVCFTERFTTAPAKAAQWKGFLKTSIASSAPTELAGVVLLLREFLQPVAGAVLGHDRHDRHWRPGGPWAE